MSVRSAGGISSRNVEIMSRDRRTTNLHSKYKKYSSNDISYKTFQFFESYIIKKEEGNRVISCSCTSRESANVTLSHLLKLLQLQEAKEFSEK